MKAYIVTHRHEVAGVFRDVAKAAEYAEKIADEAAPDPDGLWNKDASISVKQIETDLL